MRRRSLVGGEMRDACHSARGSRSVRFSFASTIIVWSLYLKLCKCLFWRLAIKRIRRSSRTTLEKLRGHSCEVTKDVNLLRGTYGASQSSFLFVLVGSLIPDHSRVPTSAAPTVRSGNPLPQKWSESSSVFLLANKLNPLVVLIIRVEADLKWGCLKSHLSLLSY